MSQHALHESIQMAKKWANEKKSQGWKKEDILAHAQRYKAQRIFNGCEIEVATAVSNAFL